MEEIKKLVDVLEKFKPGCPLKNYICYAVFPKFKNIEPNARIDFDFPLTALVGANGSGKTSLLHALWGMPYGYSTAKFWFSTELDPIEDNEKKPQRYFYGYWHDDVKDIVETRKARIGKKIDYWEPYRISTKDGMKKMLDGDFPGKSKDRWHPVRKEVVYINFRTLFGSFDRYFYFDEGIDDVRRVAMLKAAERLKKIKTKNIQSFKLGRKERVFENRELSSEEVKVISRILGRPYETSYLIRHSLYPRNRGKDLSVIFKRNSEYSEAFAGSGEVAVVSAVVDVLAAKDSSLILLDEPETSLHPGAQRELLKFLLEQIKLKKHQIVLSTHSHEFLNGLPKNAIKVFEENGIGKSRILQNNSPSAALNRLGAIPENKKRILVEDSLAKNIVLHAAKKLDQGDFERLEVKIAPGGAESILKYIGPAAMVSGDDIFIFLDGDKKKVNSLCNPDKIPPAEYPNLDDIIMKQLGFKIHYHISGGESKLHQEDKQSFALGYLKWLQNRLSYLPRKNPEEIILRSLGEDFDEENGDLKNIFKSMLVGGADIEVDAKEIETLAKVKIANISNSNNDIVFIFNQLKNWLSG